MSNRRRLFVVDASAYVFRAYYALAPLSSKGRPSHAIAGFSSMLLKLLRDHKPDACVVVFDSKAPSFRKEISKDYKANREVPPPDLSDQIVGVMNLCKAAGLPILQGEGFEADDWIASLIKKSEKEYEIVILSSDKDLTQLINDHVKMFDSFRDKWIGDAEVVEKWGVPPSQMFDLLVLTGDSSDNIPGVDGVGPKTAAKLLSEFQSIEGIYKSIPKHTPKLQERLNAAIKTIDLGKKLVALKMDLPIEVSLIQPMPEKFPKSFYEFLVDWDLTRTIKQFSEMMEGASEPSADIQPVEVKTTSKSSNSKVLVNTEGELKNLLEKCRKVKRIAFDTETSSFDRNVARIVGLSICAGNEGYYIPWRHEGGQINESIVREFAKDLLEDPQIAKIAHHAKYDIQMLEREGISVRNLYQDTMIAFYMLHADRRSFSLENLSRDFLHEEKGDLDALLGKGDDFSKIPLESAVEYAAQDAILTLKLADLSEGQLRSDKTLTWLYEYIELPLIRVLGSMESTGVLLDTKHLEELSKELHERLKKNEAKIYKIAGKEFNIASPKQLQELLFTDLKLPATKKTKTGYSTDESVLEELAHLHEVPKLIIEQRKLAKLVSTYVDVLPTMVAESDKRLHTHYHQTGTQTGRLSSSEPNLQNIPIRSEEGREIRKAFIAAPGFALMSADYSQVELRLMAHFANDEKMIEAFQNGRDIHAETAKIIFGSSDKEFRSQAKAINFGIIYGISAFGLSQQLGISRADAKKFIDSYFEQFPRIKEFMEEAQKKVRKQKFTETLFGRKRPLPDIDSKNPTLRAMAERMAINTPLQGTAADIMKWGMVRVHEEFQSKKLKSRVLLQVHDELVLEVFEGEEKIAETLVRESMSDLSNTPASNLKVPLVVDVGFGKNWAEI